MSDLNGNSLKPSCPQKSGKKRVDDRRVINGTFYVLRTSIPWADLPEQYDLPITVYNRFNPCSYAGYWDRIMEAIADARNADIEGVDGTGASAHHSGTTQKNTYASL